MTTKIDSMKSELISELRRVDIRIDGVDRELCTATDVAATAVPKFAALHVPDYRRYFALGLLSMMADNIEHVSASTPRCSACVPAAVSRSGCSRASARAPDDRYSGRGVKGVGSSQ